MAWAGLIESVRNSTMHEESNEYGPSRNDPDTDSDPDSDRNRK
jgi:hypothetical protein